MIGGRLGLTSCLPDLSAASTPTNSTTVSMMAFMKCVEDKQDRSGLTSLSIPPISTPATAVRRKIAARTARSNASNRVGNSSVKQAHLSYPKYPKPSVVSYYCNIVRERGPAGGGSLSSPRHRMGTVTRLSSMHIPFARAFTFLNDNLTNQL